MKSTVLGCLHHGHDSHTNADTLHPWLNQSMSDLFNRTMIRERQLVQQGYVVKTIWECEWDRKLKNDTVLRRTLADGIGVPRLDPRESLYGKI